MDTRGFSLALLLTGGTGLMRALLIILLSATIAGAQGLSGVSMQGANNGGADAAPSTWDGEVLSEGVAWYKDNTGPYLANRSTLRGQCVSLCSGGMTTPTSWSSSSNGDSLDCAKVSGPITVSHDNVTIKCVEITLDEDEADTGIQADAGDSVDNLLIEDSRLEGDGILHDNAGLEAVFWRGDGITITRVEFAEWEDMTNFEGNDFTVEDSLAHSFNCLCNPGNDPHYDGIETNGNMDNGLVSNSLIILSSDETEENAHPQTSGLQFNTCFGASSNLVADSNVLYGGGFPVDCNCANTGGPCSANSCTGFEFTNNRIGNCDSVARFRTGGPTCTGDGSWGYWNNNACGAATVTGNTDFYDDSDIDGDF